MASNEKSSLTAEHQIFEEHLKRKTRRSLPCSFCGSTNFYVNGPLSSPVVDIAGDVAMPTTETMPTMALVCAVCFFVRYFAWEPMRKAKEKADRIAERGDDEQLEE